jgi:hypothetical protein
MFSEERAESEDKILWNIVQIILFSYYFFTEIETQIETGRD